MARAPKRLIQLADAAISADRQWLWVRAETEDDQSLDLSIPLDQLGNTVQFLVMAAEFVVSEAEEDGHTTPKEPEAPAHDWAPIPIRGIAFAAGGSPNETLLVVKLAGFELAFSMPSDELSRLAEDIARVAQTLSADAGKRQ
ncbi:MAG: hypothetical protein JO068_00845 [Hyphomicrobiales bacterium]|nr:hypothetical protein [Hyphomicrobiales bacterium]